MEYKVRLTPPARDDAYAAYEYIREFAPTRADNWFRGLFQAMETLKRFPLRCPVISESDELVLTLRHLIYGQRSGIYRIIFDVQDHSEEGPRVRVLRIWHGARDGITVEDLGEALT